MPLASVVAWFCSQRAAAAHHAGFDFLAGLGLIGVAHLHLDLRFAAAVVRQHARMAVHGDGSRQRRVEAPAGAMAGADWRMWLAGARGRKQQECCDPSMPNCLMR